MKDHSISVDQTIYATYIVDKYLDTSTFKKIKTFHNIMFRSDMIFTKDDVCTSDDQVEKLTKELNIHYRDFIVSLIYLLYTIVYFIFAVHELEKF